MFGKLCSGRSIIVTVWGEITICWVGKGYRLRFKAVATINAPSCMLNIHVIDSGS